MRLQHAEDPTGVDLLLCRYKQAREAPGLRPWWPDNTLGLHLPDGKGGRRPMDQDTALRFQEERGRRFADLIPYARLNYTSPDEADIRLLQNAWDKAGQKTRDALGLR